MNAIETLAEFRAAVDSLLPRTHRVLRLYDRDLSLFDPDHLSRHEALRALCVAGGGRRIEFLLDDVERVALACPRLMTLLRDFGHVIEIRAADPAAPRPDQAFVLADRLGVLLRADKAAPRATLHLEDARAAAPLHQDFEAMWQRSQRHLSATTLGL